MLINLTRSGCFGMAAGMTVGGFIGAAVPKVLRLDREVANLEMEQRIRQLATQSMSDTGRLPARANLIRLVGNPRITAAFGSIFCAGCVVLMRCRSKEPED